MFNNNLQRMPIYIESEPDVAVVQNIIINTYNQIGAGIYHDSKYDHEGNMLDFNKALLCAAFGGHLDLVKKFIQLGANDFNKALCCAVAKLKYNVIDHLVEYIIEHIIEDSNRNFDLVMEIAVKKSNINMVLYLIERGVSNLNYALQWASISGNLDMVKCLIIKGATNLNYAMRCAALNKHMDVLKCIISYGANDWNATMLDSVIGGDLDMVKYLIDHSANDFTLVLEFSIFNKDIDMVKFFVEMHDVKITNFNIKSAEIYNANDIHAYLEQKMKDQNK